MRDFTPARPIAVASRRLEAAEANMKRVVRTQQVVCPHRIVFTMTSYGDDMRICPRCGREEHSPAYHTFLFGPLGETLGREFIAVESERFYAARVDQSEIVRQGRGS